MTVAVMFLSTAFVCAFGLGAMLAWSIRFLERRLWPVGTLTVTNQLLIWVPTAMIFICVIILGLIGWNDMGWPAAVRLGLGIPLNLLGNVVVWRGVFSIGVKATSGGDSNLNTSGLYRWSRNPQYVADIAILAGLAILSGAIFARLAAAGGIAVLTLAPFAEEPWLKSIHGQDYTAYSQQVRRYL